MIDKPGPEAQAFARELIEDKIDTEHQYVPDAVYEMLGKHLKEYLAYAYAAGMRAGLARGKTPRWQRKCWCHVCKGSRTIAQCEDKI